VPGILRVKAWLDCPSPPVGRWNSNHVGSRLAISEVAGFRRMDHFRVFPNPVRSATRSDHTYSIGGGNSGLSTDCRPPGSYPETGLEEINGDLPEADFGPASLKVHPGLNFWIARNPSECRAQHRVFLTLSSIETAGRAPPREAYGSTRTAEPRWDQRGQRDALESNWQ
jgi:hypothetical protein